jgi:hypothetical protein
MNPQRFSLALPRLKSRTYRPTGSGCSDRARIGARRGDQELFVPFKDFPWFKEASIREISRVELPSAHHLYWPDLDIDLAVESLTHPERYPLISQAQPNKRVQVTKAAAGLQRNGDLERALALNRDR